MSNENVVKLLNAEFPVVDYAELTDYHVVSLVEELNYDEQKLVQVIAKSLEEQYGRGKAPLVHKRYFQAKIVPLGKPHLDEKINQGGLVPGMVVQIFEDGHGKGGSAQLIKKILTSSQTAIASQSTLVGFKRLPFSKAVIINTQAELPSYLRFKKYFATGEFSLSPLPTGLIHYSTLMNFEQDFKNLKGVGLVIIDRLRGIDYGTAGHLNDLTPNAGDWLHRIKICIGDLKKLMIVFLIDKNDVDLSVWNADVIQVVSREVPQDIHLINIDMKSEDPGTWELTQQGMKCAPIYATD